jgi:hypothetical protein
MKEYDVEISRLQSRVNSSMGKSRMNRKYVTLLMIGGRLEVEKYQWSC